ncbi:Uncharacterised protein [Corynebacterium renale]|uniref:Uncharacterized protein n=2 Tax=Corynebacterium renale TaxID=1724 RepID=A0A2A9DKY5_9CORY|nr:hypothetical protein ATK06_0068 [Corynebacterium renale]SQG64246.1 Uncharacterised protein [Corynebacterium renale]SQI24421.1 Uncharacterised protein [Corynebacterium renale]STC94706.1 Uncharacterised protein [Corynebacterium renale]
MERFGTIYGMANVEKKDHANPSWPAEIPGYGHVVTELTAQFAGASSPYGDDTVLPVPAEKTGYVHPYTRINK